MKKWLWRVRYLALVVTTTGALTIAGCGLSDREWATVWASVITSGLNAAVSNALDSLSNSTTNTTSSTTTP